MATIEFDQDWEQYDAEEQKRMEEMFPVIEKPMVRAQFTSWDTEELPKLGHCVILTATIIEDPDYAGKELRKALPTTGRMKFITKQFLDGMGVKRSGKSFDPDTFMGKVVNMVLSVAVNPETGRKRTQIDSVTPA